METDTLGYTGQVYVKVNQEAEADPSIHDEARLFFKRMEDGEIST
jgi:arginyl-tRNA synthetase